LKLVVSYKQFLVFSCSSVALLKVHSWCYATYNFFTASWLCEVPKIIIHWLFVRRLLKWTADGKRV